MIIKILLIASIVAVSLILLRDGGSAGRLALGRLATLVFVAAGVLAVLFPDLVTWAANAVGVGRGTDLLLYALVVAFLFSTVSQRRHTRQLEERFATLARELALHGARPPAGSAATPARVGHER